MLPGLPAACDGQAELSRRVAGLSFPRSTKSPTVDRSTVSAPLYQTIEPLDTERVTMIARSLAGGLQLDFHPDDHNASKNSCCEVAMSREWRPARRDAFTLSGCSV